MGRILSITIFILLGIAIGFQAEKWIPGSQAEPEEGQADAAKIEAIFAEGKIKPAQGIRLVTTLPGRKVSKLMVEKGTPTIAGETVLYEMQDESLFKLQWELAQSRKEDLALEVEQKILAAEINAAAANAKLREARLHQERLQDDSPESSYVDRRIASFQKKLQRLKELANSEATSAFVSTQELLEQELELEKAKSEKESLKLAADLAVETAQQTLDLANRALNNAQQARQPPRSIKLAEAIAKNQYDNSKIVAPADGEVIRIHLREGDTVANFPLLEIADLSSLIVEAEVYFANLNEVRTGQSVRISSPALTSEMTGRVISKTNYIGAGILQSPNPLAMADQETAKVKIQIDPSFNEIARSFLNLQVSVEIDTK